jgi:hypothetical protein
MAPCVFGLVAPSSETVAPSTWTLRLSVLNSPHLLAGWLAAGWLSLLTVRLAFERPLSLDQMVCCGMMHDARQAHPVA